MREIGESEEMEREFELKALRSQMNLHFLYNTLSVINWKAMERGADDICEVVQLLSTFYRTALNHGSDMISVENELKNVCSYIQLQQIMHDKKIGQHRTIAEASAVESPIRQETIGFPAHFFARAHNFKPPGRACQPEADSPMRT